MELGNTGRPPNHTARPDHVEAHTEWPVLSGVDVQGTIYWGHQEPDNCLHLEMLGLAQVQILCLVDRAEQSLVVRPAREARMGPQLNLPAM